MKIFKIVHISNEKFEVIDKITGEVKEKTKFTEIGTGFQKENKNNISLKFDFLPINFDNGYIHLIPKNYEKD